MSTTTAEVLDQAFLGQPTDALATTSAVVAVQRGEVVAERYGEAVDAETTLLSRSMAKSITHALVGFAVDDGLLGVHAPAPVPEWSAPGTPAGRSPRTSSCACAPGSSSARTIWTSRCRM